MNIQQAIGHLAKASEELRAVSSAGSSWYLSIVEARELAGMKRHVQSLITRLEAERDAR